MGCETTKSASCDGRPLAAPPQISMVHPSPDLATGQQPQNTKLNKRWPYGASLGCMPPGFMPGFVPTDITSQPFERQAANDMVLTGEGYPATLHACPHSDQMAPG